VERAFLAIQGKFGKGKKRMEPKGKIAFQGGKNRVRLMESGPKKSVEDQKVLGES